MTKRPHRAVSEVFRKDLRPRLDDPYRHLEKYQSDTECPGCGLLFQAGEWRTAVVKPTHELHQKLCPACLQIRDDYPGGILHASGSFLKDHRDDVLNRVRNVAGFAAEEHPLERIMRIEEGTEGFTVYVTSEHLAARMGKALRNDFGGDLNLKYAQGDKFADVSWSRND